MPNTAPEASLCIFLDPDEWRPEASLCIFLDPDEGRPEASVCTFLDPDEGWVLAPPILHQYSNKILTWEF